MLSSALRPLLLHPSRRRSTRSSNERPTSSATIRLDRQSLPLTSPREGNPPKQRDE